MGTLVTRCQQRCDRENDNHISTGEWKSLISEQYGELWGIVAGTGLRYFETSAIITTTGDASYDEPADHLGTVLIARVDTNGGRRDLEEIQAQERARWIGRTGDAYCYSLVDDQIYLYPTPPLGQNYEILYIPQPTDISGYLDSDPVDIVNADGLAFMIWGVAVKALAKSESDVQLAISEREASRGRLADWATERSFLSQRRRQVDDGYTDLYNRDSADWRFR